MEICPRKGQVRGIHRNRRPSTSPLQLFVAKDPEKNNVLIRTGGLARPIRRRVWSKCFTPACWRKPRCSPIEFVSTIEHPGCERFGKFFDDQHPARAEFFAPFRVFVRRRVGFPLRWLPKPR
jgi:hypothetical protein